MLRLDNFVYSGFSFSEDEDLFKFQVKLLNTIFFIGFVATTLFASMSVAGINPFSVVHEISLYIYAFFTVVFHLFLRQNKSHYNVTIDLFLVVNFTLFIEALILVPEDPFRMIWFYILVFLSFIFKSAKVGFFYTSLSIGSIIVYELLAEKPDAFVSVSSATLGLVILSSLFYVYTKKFTEYEYSLEKERKSLKHLATTDCLTQTKNRHFFTQRSEDLFNASKHDANGLVIILMDIDLFKDVNDTYGHQAGDHVLIHMAKVIKKSVHKAMTFSRIGGEEFALLINTMSIYEAKSLAEEIRAEVEKEKFIYLKENIDITISIGIAMYHKDDSDFSDIFARADQALYNAKDQGRNLVNYVEKL